MPGALRSRPLPLPRHWPRRARSAAMHAISLADLAFTKTLHWSAGSLNPRLRHQTNLGPLQRKIAFLGEGTGFKHGRMEPIEPPGWLPDPALACLAIPELPSL